jgi:hypothetical protein
MRRRSFYSSFFIAFIFLIINLMLLIQPSVAQDTIPDENFEIDQMFAGGSGKHNDPYQISDIFQLQNITNELRANFTLINDIDASKTHNTSNFYYFSVGYEKHQSYWSDPPNKFEGFLNGNNYSIRNLLIKTTNRNWGLFRHVGKSGLIKDLTLKNFAINGRQNLGVISGVNDGIIMNCSIYGNLSGDESLVGGITGSNNGLIINCKIYSNISGYNNVGGIAGDGNGKISNCVVNGFILGNTGVGGITGENEGDIKDCTFIGDISGHDELGGIAGHNLKNITDCNSQVNISGNHECGGLVGGNGGLIQESYSKGNVEGTGWVGGLIGDNWVTISNCSFQGTVTGDENVGGLIGRNHNEDVLNSNCQAVVIGKTNVGGLIGATWRGKSGPRIESCSFKGTVSGKLNIGGLVGNNVFDIYSSSAECDVTGSWNVGGLVGQQIQDYRSGLGKIRFSEFNGSVTGEYCTGCIVGITDGWINNCEGSGNINGGIYTGGIAGWSSYKIGYSNSSCFIKGEEYQGEIVGIDFGEIKNCSSIDPLTKFESDKNQIGWKPDTNMKSNWWHRSLDVDHFNFIVFVIIMIIIALCLELLILISKKPKGEKTKPEDLIKELPEMKWFKKNGKNTKPVPRVEDLLKIKK